MTLHWGIVPGVLALAAAEAFATAPAPPTSVELVLRTPTSALIRWAPSADPTKGYKIRNSAVAGVHPDPTSYPGGKSAAFTWTTDDGWDMNLVYDQIFSPRGLTFTAFINSGTIGRPNKMSWSDVRFLYTQGHEIANHDRDHTSLIDDRAIAVRYTGVEACNVEVQGVWLRTYVESVLDLEMDLRNPDWNHLVELAASLDAQPDYEAALLYSDLEISATQSTFLDNISFPIGAGAPAGTLTTERGVHDDQEMFEQIHDSEVAIEAEMAFIAPGFECRTFAYPNHAHTQWAMSTLNRMGYRGARSGNQGVQPFFSEGSYELGFMTTYETPMNFPRPDNTWDEAFTRSKYQARIAAWKSVNTWAVLMAHDASESDSAHVDWMIDEIAADPDIWVAPFQDVIDYLNGYYVDVGLPLDPQTGKASAWIHDLERTGTSHVVVTAYNDALEESIWSDEIVIPPFRRVKTLTRGSEVPVLLAIAPNPFVSSTRVGFSVPARGPVRLQIFDVRGARLLDRDLGVLPSGSATARWDGRRDGRPVPAGTYFVRVSGPSWSEGGRVQLVR